MAVPQTILGFPIKAVEPTPGPAKTVTFGDFGVIEIPITITKQDDGTYVGRAVDPAQRQLVFELLVAAAEDREDK